MLDLRTTGSVLLILLGANIISISKKCAVSSFKIDERVNTPEKAFHIRDVTAEVDDNSEKSLITYQQINHLKPLSDDNDDDWRLFEIKFTDIAFGGEGIDLLIATPSAESCEESSSRPAWKIDKSVGNFLVKINHAKQFAGKTFFLCSKDEATGQWKHFGNESRFSIG